VLFPKLVEIMDPEPHPGPLNMAIDEALLRQAMQPTLRVYRWSEPSVSCGYFSKLGVVEEVAAGRPVVRRWTGGGIVEHGDDLTYTLVVPRGDPFFRHSAAESYRLIHERIARLLADAGVSAEVLPSESGAGSSACFVRPVQYDVVVNTVKIAGAAQRRTRWGLLHQGSIQMKPRVVALHEKLAPAFGVQHTTVTLSADVLNTASALAAAQYGSAAWREKF
jgi:lipoate-protein ligase A